MDFIQSTHLHYILKTPLFASFFFSFLCLMVSNINHQWCATSIFNSIVDLNFQKSLNWLPAYWAPICLEPQNFRTPIAHTLKHNQNVYINYKRFYLISCF